jgi:hypothetical protein
LGRSAYITFVEGSTVQQVSLQDVKEKINHYIDMVNKTAKQLDWEYNNAAFPYTIVEKPEARGQWLYLQGKDSKLYKYILVGVGSRQIEKKAAQPKTDGDEETSSVSTPTQEHYIQITLTEESTHGDKGKANEFCKHLGKEYKAQVQLFNDRVMYYNPRK